MMLNNLPHKGKILQILIIVLNSFILLWIVRGGAFVPGAAWIDTRSFYIAGRCWLDGLSPYDYEIFRQYWFDILSGDTDYTPFLFPPTLALISIPISLLPWSIARWVISTLNISALLLIWIFTFLLILEHPNIRSSRSSYLVPLLFVGLSGSLSAIPAVIFLGQKTLFAVCGCMGAIFFWRRNLPYLSGLFALLATFKPQISLLILAYLFFTSNLSFKIRCFGFFAGCIAAIIVFLLPPIPELMHQLEISYIAYRKIPFNQYSNYISILSIFKNSRDQMLVIFTTCSLIFVAYLAWLRRYSYIKYGNEYVIQQADYIGHIQMICATTVFLLPIRQYDLVLLIPVIVTLPILRPKFWIPITLLPLIILGRLNTVENLLSKLIGQNWLSQHLNIVSLCLAGLIFGFFIIIWQLYRKPLRMDASFS